MGSGKGKLGRSERVAWTKAQGLGKITSAIAVPLGIVQD